MFQNPGLRKKTAMNPMKKTSFWMMFRLENQNQGLFLTDLVCLSFCFTSVGFHVIRQRVQTHHMSTAAALHFEATTDSSDSTNDDTPYQWGLCIEIPLFAFIYLRGIDTTELIYTFFFQIPETLIFL